MPGKIYFYLLTLCGICSQGIRIFAEEIKESSDFLVRQKRVISQVPEENHPTPIKDVPYVVIIRQNRRISCVGSILSHHVVITITGCVRFYTFREYQVVSGTTRKDRGYFHYVTDIQRKFFNIPSRPADGIALLAVDPSFVYGRFTHYIDLHSGPLISGIFGLISGWGYNRCTRGGSSAIDGNLRTIAVSIIRHQDCVNMYEPHINITDKDVCTYHPQRHCGHTDGGAPLVVDGQLAGVHLWTGLNGGQNDHRYPDVFALLQHFEFNQWISTNVRNIEAQLQDQDD